MTRKSDTPFGKEFSPPIGDGRRSEGDSPLRNDSKDDHGGKTRTNADDISANDENDLSFTADIEEGNLIIRKKNRRKNAKQKSFAEIPPITGKSGSLTEITTISDKHSSDHQSSNEVVFREKLSKKSKKTRHKSLILSDIQHGSSFKPYLNTDACNSLISPRKIDKNLSSPLGSDSSSSSYDR